MLGRALALRLQHRLRHLLHEQGNAVGALDDVLPDARRQRLVADDAVDHGADFALRQPIDGEGGHVRSSDPGRLEFRPERHDQQYAKCRDPLTARPNTSRLVGSVQCASSKIISTGLERVSAFSCEMSASNVLCRRCCGARSSAG